jgi:hypothetical protein
MSVKNTDSQHKSSLLNFLINILLPTLILTKFSSPKYLGQELGFLVAICMPLAYGLSEFFSTKKANVFSVIGVASIFLTGGIGLLQIDVKWLAIKEAAIPFVLGVIVIISAKGEKPLLKLLLDQLLDHEKIHAILEKENKLNAFKIQLKKATYFFASSFFLSSILNYVLTKHLVISQTGTQAFNEELGKLTLFSYPVIVIPSMIVMIFSFWTILSFLKKETALTTEELFKV